MEPRSGKSDCPGEWMKSNITILENGGKLNQICPFPGRWVHNFQPLRGLGGQGGELGILRRWFFLRWGGKMRPASFDGYKVLSSCPVSARPRLPGAHHPGPRATSQLWPTDKSIIARPGAYSQQVLPLCLFTVHAHGILALTHNSPFPYTQFTPKRLLPGLGDLENRPQF
jgi:hypothetical protein